MAKVITTQDAAFTAFTQATQHAQSRANAAEAERAATEAARLALPTQVAATTGPAIAAAQAAANMAAQRAGVVGSVPNDAALAGRAAGDYRIGVEIVSWNGNAVTARTAVLASQQEVQTAVDRLTANTLTDLRALPPGAARHVVVLGHATPGDWGPPRIARWVAGSGEADDNGMRIRPTLGGGCWAFATDLAGFVHSRWYNLDPDGLTDLAPTINSILTRFDLMLDLHPDLDLDPGGAARALYRIDSTVTVAKPRRLWGASATTGSVTIDASRVGGGTPAVDLPTVLNPASGTADHEYHTVLKHFELRGAGKVNGQWQQAVGLMRSGSSYRCEHIVIAGFLYGEFVRANNTYVTDMVDCVIATNGTNVKYESVTPEPGGPFRNSGEKLVYSGGYIGGGDVGVDIPDGWEVTFRNVSLDYNRVQMALTGLSSVTFVAGHIEWDSETPLVLMGPDAMADVFLDGTLVLRIDESHGAVFPLRREHLLDNEYGGLGGNRGSIQGHIHSGRNGTQRFGFSAKKMIDAATFYALGNYYNDASVPLRITWALEFNPDNGTGAVFNAYCDTISLEAQEPNVFRGDARRALQELVPFGTPAGTIRTVSMHVPAGTFFGWSKNDYINVLNVMIESFELA